MVETLIIEGSIGGIPRKKYWRPDGQEVQSIPAMRLTSKGDSRDANYDNGWLDSPPTELKITCPHCHYWHDTQKEVDECGVKIKARQAKFDRLARKQVKGEVKQKDKEIDTLRSELSELKDMVAQLLKKGEQ